MGSNPEFPHTRRAGHSTAVCACCHGDAAVGPLLGSSHHLRFLLATSISWRVLLVMFDSRKLASWWGWLRVAGITSHSEWLALFDTWPLSMFTNTNTKFTARCFSRSTCFLKKFPVFCRSRMYYCIHNRVHMVPVLSQINPVPTTIQYFGKTICVIFSRLRFGLIQVSWLKYCAWLYVLYVPPILSCLSRTRYIVKSTPSTLV